MSLLTENGNTKDDLRLPTDDNLLTQVGLTCISFPEMVVFLLNYLLWKMKISLWFYFFCIIDFITDNIIDGCVQIKDGFGDGKDLVVTVMSAMGEEQIAALKDIGPK